MDRGTIQGVACATATVHLLHGTYFTPWPRRVLETGLYSLSSVNSVMAMMKLIIVEFSQVVCWRCCATAILRWSGSPGMPLGRNVGREWSALTLEAGTWFSSSTTTIAAILRSILAIQCFLLATTPPVQLRPLQCQRLFGPHITRRPAALIVVESLVGSPGRTEQQRTPWSGPPPEFDHGPASFRARRWSAGPPYVHRQHGVPEGLDWDPGCRYRRRESLMRWRSSLA